MRNISFIERTSTIVGVSSSCELLLWCKGTSPIKYTKLKWYQCTAHQDRAENVFSLATTALKRQKFPLFPLFEVKILAVIKLSDYTTTHVNSMVL